MYSSAYTLSTVIYKFNESNLSKIVLFIFISLKVLNFKKGEYEVRVLLMSEV